MDEKDFSLRLAQLREKKGVSARDMSLSLGQSESYINKIENGRTMPSMSGFFYICEYFAITPQQFFDVSTSSPVKTEKINSAIKKLSSVQSDHILSLINDLIEK